MTPLSRIEEILYSYNNGVSYDKEPLSRIEAILLYILFDGQYKLSYPLSRIEEQLLYSGAYTGIFGSRIEEIIKSKIEGYEYSGDRLSRIEEEAYDLSTSPFEYIGLEDDTGDYILDSDGDVILVTVGKSQYPQVGDSEGGVILDSNSDPILSKIRAVA